MTDEIKRIGLDIDALVRRLAESLLAARATESDTSSASAAQLRELVDTTFFASLERDEGRFAAPAVALVTDSMMSARGANRKDWAPIAFATPKSFDVATLVKLAAAVDRRQSLVAVAERESRLVIVGIVRTNTMLYRFSRGESSWASGAGYSPVIVTAADVGTITIDVGEQRFATVSHGQLLPEGVDVFAGGPIFSMLDRFAQASSLDLDLYSRLVKRVLHQLADRGHGGIVLILPDNEQTFLRPVYSLSQPSSSLQDAIRFASGARLGPTAETSVCLVDAPKPDPGVVEVARQRRRAIEEHDFEVDTASFVADWQALTGRSSYHRIYPSSRSAPISFATNPRLCPCRWVSMPRGEPSLGRRRRRSSNWEQGTTPQLDIATIVWGHSLSSCRRMESSPA